MKSLLITSLLTLLTITPLLASRAGHGVMMLRQPDGKSVPVLLHGDEHYNYYTTLSGRPLLQLPDGRVVPSTWEVVHQQAWSEAQRSHQSAQSQPGQQRVTIDGFPAEASHFLPHMGEPHIPVILMEFPNKPFTYSREEIGEWLNGTQTQFTSSTQSTSSVAGYFEFSSQGQFRPVFDVYGPYTTSQEEPYYGYDQGLNTSARRLVGDALLAADGDVDFSLYDNYYDDQCLDLVYVIFSGEGANNSGDKTQPWSISGTVASLGIFDGVQSWRYGLSSELIVGGGNTYQAGIGVFCHELSHTMGLPDLYDAGSLLSNWDNNGPEAWDLMDDGENLVNGMWPMPYVAWERDAFGWISLDELSAPQDVTLYPLNDPQGRGRALRITNPDCPTEYYTLEVIPTQEHYAWLSRYNVPSGLLITHIEYVDNLFAANRVNSTSGHPHLTIVPADGYLLSSASVGEERVIDGETILVDRPYYRAQLGGDPYPGTRGVEAVNSLHNYQGADDLALTHSITHIVANEDGSVSFRYMGGSDQALSRIASDQAPTAIYTLDGRKLKATHVSQLPVGIYVVDGERVVVR